MSRPAVILVLLLLLALTAPVQAIPLLDGLGGAAGYGEGTVAADGVPGPLDLTPAFPEGFRFFGSVHRMMWVNVNGTVSFRGPVAEMTPSPFPIADQPMIAAWWAGVDIRSSGAPARNAIYWDLSPGRLVVTWHNVGYFSNHDERANDFQVILSTNLACPAPRDFQIELRYHRCEWTTGDGSGGMGGLGGTAAQVGFDAGDLRNYVALPMSRTDAILDVCRRSNVPMGEPGLFRFGLGVVDYPSCTGGGTPCTIPDQQGIRAMGVNVCTRTGLLCLPLSPPRERRCDGLDNDCDGAPDVDDVLCPSGQVCDIDRCAPRCGPAGDCPAGTTCTERGACVEAACAEVTCPQPQRCVQGRCAGRCDGFICPYGQSCRFGRCVDPCRGVTCGSGEVCRDGVCQPGCRCSACAMGARCQPDGTCEVERCVGVTCPVGMYCLDGACRDSCEHGPDTLMCPEGEHCVQGACIAGSEPVDAGVDAGTDEGSVDVMPDGGWDAGTGRDVSAERRYAALVTGCGCAVGSRGCNGTTMWMLAVLAGAARWRRKSGCRRG